MKEYCVGDLRSCEKGVDMEAEVLDKIMVMTLISCLVSDPGMGRSCTSIASPALKLENWVSYPVRTEAEDVTFPFPFSIRGVIDAAAGMGLDSVEEEVEGTVSSTEA